MAFDKAEHQVKTREAFDTLTKIVEQIRAVSTPLREKRDALVRAHRAEEDAINTEIARAEDGLFAAEQERAMHARQLSANRALPAESAGVVNQPQG
jgi:hypothetical protein